MSIVYLADAPRPLYPPRSTGAPVLVQATESAMVWRQTYIFDGVPYAHDLTYAGSFRYGDPQRPEATATGTVTEVTWVFNDDVVTFRWAGFSSSLEVMDRADMTVGGWESFYRTILLPGDDLLTSTRAVPEEFRGYDGADTISSGANADTLDGGAGSDYLRGGDGADSISGGPDADDINGNRGADTIDGGAGDDILRGGKGGDRLIGGSGDDQLFGDLGSDTLTGGEGADLFHVAPDDGEDLITDFSAAQGDRIAIDWDGDFTTQQVGDDIRLTLIYGNGAGPYTTEIIIQGAQLSAMSEGWLTR